MGTPPLPRPAGARDPGIPPAATMAEAAAAARACTVCAPHLPLGPRPIHQLHARARILVTSQAPGTKAHLSGIPFEDASGERLRDWLGLGRDLFYDPEVLAILPMGMCYPGRLPRGGDAPPRPECAPLWHPRILPRFTNLRIRLLVGSHAIRHVLGPRMPLAERVARYAEALPAHFPLPHPSWRTLVWAKRNPWFDTEVIPALRREVARALSD
ncbi:uracil-DNA glycosylase family protein [Roseomonas populi]